jgi:hypothetical protein
MAQNEPPTFSHFPCVTYILIICDVITDDHDTVNKIVYRFHNISDTIRRNYMGIADRK